MWSWLAGVDPDKALAVLTFIGTVGGWIYRKAKGQEQEGFKSIVNEAIDNFILEMFDELTDDQAVIVNVKGYVAAARAKIDKHIWSVLQKLGVPKTKTTERWVAEARERGTAKLANLVLERRAQARARKGL